MLLKYICCLLLLELLLLSDYDVAFDVVADFDIDRAAEDLNTCIINKFIFPAL